MDEILQEFLAEALEHLDRFEHAVEVLGGAPSDPVALEEGYRSLHTIKGAAGFLGLPSVETLTAAGELLLGRAQKGQLAIAPEHCQALAEAGRRLRRHLENLSASGHEAESAGDAELAERIVRLAAP